jgi:TPR repeat protein
VVRAVLGQLRLQHVVRLLCDGFRSDPVLPRHGQWNARAGPRADTGPGSKVAAEGDFWSRNEEGRRADTARRPETNAREAILCQRDAGHSWRCFAAWDQGTNLWLWKAGVKMKQQEPQCEDGLLRKDAEAGNVAAKYHYALECSDPEERRRWLKEAVEADYIPAMCAYALTCDDADERKHWLREAAYEGDVHAIYCYALECRDPEQRKRWLKQAAEAENVDAMYTYSQECEDPTEAEYWLTKTALEGHAQAMYEYAMRCDDLAERRWWLTCAARQGWESAVEALESLE